LGRILSGGPRRPNCAELTVVRPRIPSDKATHRPLERIFDVIFMKGSF
jgi:hypothetical protein